MPRNGSGSYSLPEAAFVSGTVISSTAVNSDFSDIATALTDSLARDGQGGMLEVLPLDPSGFAYTTDPTTGMHRTSSGAQAIKCNGDDIVEIDQAGANVNGNLLINGIRVIPIGLGPIPWSGTTAPGGWVLVGKTYSRTTYADLWAFAQAQIALGNMFYSNGDGTTTFGVGLNMPGRVPACNDSISGSAAGVLTQAVFGSDPAILGDTGGEQAHTLTQTEMPAHSHGVTDPGHQHSAGSGNFANTGNSGNVYGTGSQGAQSANTGSAQTNISIQNTGGGAAHNNVQPTIITNYIVFAGV